MTMLARIIFCIAVAGAILTVILLALLSPLPKSTSPESCLDLSLYIHSSVPPSTIPDIGESIPHNANTAFIFRHVLTQGPEIASPVIGRAQGFIIPIENYSERSAFNMVYISFDSPEMFGSLSLEAMMNGGRLVVVGGTGVFALARGHAAFQRSSSAHQYCLKLWLKFPDETHTGSVPTG